MKLTTNLCRPIARRDKYPRLFIPALFYVASCCSAVAGINQEEGFLQFPEVRLHLTKGEFKKIKHSGTRVTFSNPVMTINKDTVHVKDLHTRGKSSLQFSRKSLSVDLEKSVHVRLGFQEADIKKFDLVNLIMDKNLWRNRWSFLNLEALGMFPLINGYCTLWINDEPQGIYLLIEKPHYAVSSGKSPFMIRRGPDHHIDDEYIDTPSKEEVKMYRSQFHDLYNPSYATAGLFTKDELDTKINLENYFKWIGFNYLVMNGDYADEVFLYVHPETKVFEILPWDYDDILKPSPHEGWEVRKQQYPNALFYSLEDDLDRSIVGNKDLYQAYTNTFTQLLMGIDSAVIFNAGARVLQELEAISKDRSVAQSSKYLDSDPFVFERAKDEMAASLTLINTRRNSTLELLKRDH